MVVSERFVQVYASCVNKSQPRARRVLILCASKDLILAIQSKSQGFNVSATRDCAAAQRIPECF